MYKIKKEFYILIYYLIFQNKNISINKNKYLRLKF